MKAKIALIATLVLMFNLGAGAAHASKELGLCKTVGNVKVVADQNYTCSKMGKKRVWKRSLPSPELQATAGGSQVNFGWASTFAQDKILHFELGIALLKTSGLEPTVQKNYSRTQIFSRVTGSVTSLTFADVRGFIERQSLNPAGQAAVVGVRAITKDGASPWSNGFYLTYEFLTAGGQSSSPSAPSPSPGNSGESAPSSSSKTFTNTGFGTISCPKGSSAVDGGLGFIPEPVWTLSGDPRRSPAGYVTQRTATFSWSFGVLRASGQETIYTLDSQGGYVGPNGATYRVVGPGSWSPPVWISCFASKYPLEP